MPTLVSVNVGRPREVAWNGVTVHTGAWKDPVDGPRLVRRLGLDGDGQGDTAGHGGPHRAVLVYQRDSYDYWREHFGRDDLRPGTFAENLTVEGLGDTEVCIGDRYRIGEAEFEVSQPRVTCYRAGLRIGEPRLAALLVAHHRPGFYLRVITEGRIRAGDEIVRTVAGPGQVSVTEVDALLYLPRPDLETLRRAVALSALSPGWRGSLRELLEGATNVGPPSPATAEPAWAGFRALLVADIAAESPTVASISLTDPDGATLPHVRPGQYLSVRVPVGAGGAVRSYSLSSAPDADLYRISVKREPGGLVSGYLHDSVRPGTELQVAAPRGDFVLTDDPRPVVLASAGYRDHPGVGDAAPNWSPRAANGGCGGSTPPATPARRPSRPRPASCWAHSRTRGRRSTTAPRPTCRHYPRMGYAGACQRIGSSPTSSRQTPSPTSAGRPGS